MKLTNINYSSWADTKDTLHLFLQIIGKINLEYDHRKNHWWHISYKVFPQGITTNIFYIDEKSFEVRFNFFEHRLEVLSETTNNSFSLKNLSVKDFYQKTFELFDKLNLKINIKNPTPFDCNSTIAFDQDDFHKSYDHQEVEEWFDNIKYVDQILRNLRTNFKAKISPVHLFWHSFDMATTLFTGRVGPAMENVDSVTRDAYSDEVVSFGWWPGDHKSEKAAFYAYAHPEPKGINNIDISEFGGSWIDKNGSHLAVLENETILNSNTPKKDILKFFKKIQKETFTKNGWSEENIHYDL